MDIPENTNPPESNPLQNDLVNRESGYTPKPNLMILRLISLALTIAIIVFAVLLVRKLR